MERLASDIEYLLALEMLQLRYWQHVINEELKRKRFNVPIHVAMGHEAIAVALGNAIRPEDQFVLSHRNVAYNLVRLRALRPVYDEYRLLAPGAAGGRLGSMNLAKPEAGVPYASSILGNNLSVGCGLALGRAVLGQPGIVVVLMGDGAIEEGGFYEGLVFAKSHALKVLVIIENDNHSMASTIEERRCAIDLGNVCAAIDVPYTQLSGNDVVEYVAELERVHGETERSGPGCVEVLLSTLNRHAGPTPGWATDPMRVALEDGLIIEETQRDPLHVLKKRITPEVFERLADQVLAEGWQPARE